MIFRASQHAPPCLIRIFTSEDTDSKGPVLRGDAPFSREPIPVRFDRSEDPVEPPHLLRREEAGLLTGQKSDFMRGRHRLAPREDDRLLRQRF